MLCSLLSHPGDSLQVSVTLSLQGKFPLLGNQGLEEDKADWSLCPEWIWAVSIIYLQTSETGSILK